MKKTIIATTVAALLAASAMPALAQDAGVQVDAGAGVTVDTPAVDAAAGADANAKANANANAAGVSDNTYGSVVSSIMPAIVARHAAAGQPHNFAPLPLAGEGGRRPGEGVSALQT